MNPARLNRLIDKIRRDDKNLGRFYREGEQKKKKGTNLLKLLALLYLMKNRNE